MVEEILHTFEATLNFIENSVADLKDKELIQHPVGFPHHGIWILGHLIFSCQGIAVELGIDPWLPDDWESKFGYGSKPISDLEHYPKKTELLNLLNDSKNRLREKVVNLADTELKKSLPDASLPTVSHLLLQVIIAHTAYHAGQLTSWRRGIGKKSIGVFV